MKVYVMRHGTTVWNEKGITQGRSRNRLSEKGKTLVLDAALKFKDVSFDIIFASPLMRTVQTANIMNRYHSAKIIKDNRLIEIDQGIFTGRRKDSLTKEERDLKFARSGDCGLESYESVYERTLSFVNELKNNSKFENVLIVTHNVNASLMEQILKGVNVDLGCRAHLRCFNNADVKFFEI